MEYNSGEKITKLDVQFNNTPSVEYRCELCPQHFTTIDKLNSHIQLHFKIYNCDQCNEKIIGEFLYKFHKATLHSTKLQSRNVKCKICDKFFTNNRNSVVHMQRMHKLRYINCKFCTEKFETKSLLVKHYSEMHPGLSEHPPYICPTCGKDFNKNRAQLKQHLITHLPVKPFICDICGKEFARKTNMTFHVRTHTGEKPLQCKICNKQFCHGGNLISHMRLHTKVKPYKCSYCDKSYSQPTDLRRHKRVHENTEKKFKCNLCDYRCYEARFLRRHEITHSVY